MRLGLDGGFFELSVFLGVNVMKLFSLSRECIASSRSRVALGPGVKEQPAQPEHFSRLLAKFLKRVDEGHAQKKKKAAKTFSLVSDAHRVQTRRCKFCGLTTR